MSTNLEYRERERQRKRDSRRQASEAQREKERQRARARDKKRQSRISLEQQHENFIPASSGQQGENERLRKKKMRTGTQATTVNKCTKKCAARAKLVLLFFFFRSLCRRR